MMSTLKNKKLLIIGGDSFSVDIVKTAQSMGIYTIVTDWYDTKRSPAKLVADEYWNTSIEDYDSLPVNRRTDTADTEKSMDTTARRYILPALSVESSDPLVVPCHELHPEAAESANTQSLVW